MSKKRSMVTTRSQLLSSSAAYRTPPSDARPLTIPSGLLQIQLIGQELRVEGLQMLLSAQKDMELLAPVSDLDQAVEVVARLCAVNQPISVVVMDWDGPFEKNYSVLKVLSSMGLRCLVVSSLIYPSELEEIKAAGACGYCFAAASGQQFVQAIRKVAKGNKVFLFPEHGTELLPNLKVHRKLVFNRERLEARAAEIGWQLTKTDVAIIYYIFMFANEKTEVIAEKVTRKYGTVRTDLSVHVYFYLHMLADREFSSRITAFQVLLEFGIFEYK